MNSKSPAVSDRSAKLVLRASLGCAFTVGLVACGGADVQPVAPTTTKPVATAAAPVDVSEVPEPEGLAVVVRASNVDDTIKTAGSWAHIPLPKATDLVRSVSDDSLASVLDLSKPIDGAVVVQRNMKGILAAFSVAVSSVDAAKSKLESTYKVKPGSNGQFVVEGIGGTPSSHADASRAPTSDESDESDDDGLSCVLTPAPVGGRLVCGDSMVSVKALAPYLARTVSRQTWSSPLHIEGKFAALREALDSLNLPSLARSFGIAKGPAMAALIDGFVGEIGEILTDTRKLAIDVGLGDQGATLDIRHDWGSKKSLMSQLSASQKGPAAVPGAFWHLPSDATLATFAGETDRKLWSHAGDLVGDALIELASGAQAPESESRFARDLIVQRTFPIWMATKVTGSGVDAQALEKAVKASDEASKKKGAQASESSNVAAMDVVLQNFGWKLFRADKPISDVGPVLKEWTQVRNRPALAAWIKKELKDAPFDVQSRTTPIPAGVSLPKDAVHAEFVVRIDEGKILASRHADPKAPKAKTPAKVISRTLHVYAVPDGGATWVALGFGDPKSLAQRVYTSLSTSPDTGTLKENAVVAKALAGVEANTGGVLTWDGIRAELKGALPSSSSSSTAAVPPVVITSVWHGPSEGASVGSTTAKMLVPRAMVETVISEIMK